jgi:hypothetical protein
VVLEDVEGGLITSRLHVESLFSRSNGHLELYDLGHHHELLGADSDDMVSGSSGITATVEDVNEFARVLVEGGLVPGFIEGQLTGPIDDDLEIAVALDGRIQTVVPVFGVEDGHGRFSAILPDDAFVEGFNHLQLLAVSGTASPIVERIELAGLVFFELQFADDDKVEALVDDKGRSWALQTESTVVGTVDSATWLAPEAGGADLMDLQLTGWAVNEARVEPAELIVFFSDDKFVGMVDVDVMREDIRDNYLDDNVLHSGFVVRLRQFSAVEGAAIRPFAISKGAAYEIGILDSAREAIELG